MGRKRKSKGGPEHYNLVPQITLKARNRTQSLLIKSMRDNDVTFALGAAGTGKTYCAMTFALKQLLNGQAEKVIVVRPVVEAGENLGFLPGAIRQKMDPYLQPAYDAIELSLGPKAKNQLLGDGKMEISPLAYMRGRTLRNAVVVLDEAQNASQDQFEMFLTRIGEGSTFVICGDHTQSDLKGKVKLPQVANSLKDVPGVGVVLFEKSDVVRHPIIGKIIEKFEEMKDARKKEERQIQRSGRPVPVGSVSDERVGQEQEAPDLVNA